MEGEAGKNKKVPNEYELNNDNETVSNHRSNLTNKKFIEEYNRSVHVCVIHVLLGTFLSL